MPELNSGRSTKPKGVGNVYLAIDAGGTNLRLGWFDSLDSNSPLSRESFRISQDYLSNLNLIKNIVNQKGLKLKSAGISVPGSIKGEAMSSSFNLPGWVGRPIVKDLSLMLGCPVYLDNDALNQARAEADYTYDDKQDFLYVAWGTGLGVVLVKTANDTEYSYEYIDSSVRGKWEDKLGGNNLQKLYGKKPEYLSDSEWYEVIQDFILALESLTELYGVRSIHIGGGIAIKQSNRISKCRLKERISITSLGEDIGLFGGLALIKDSSHA